MHALSLFADGCERAEMKKNILIIVLFVIIIIITSESSWS